MQTQQEHTQLLFNKIQRLPPDKVAVVDDFVDFLENRCKEEMLIKAAGKLLVISGIKTSQKHRFKTSHL